MALQSGTIDDSESGTEEAFSATTSADFSPDQGYALVKVVYERPPSEAQTLVREFDDPEEITVPDGTPKLGYVVYDADGNTYTRDELERDALGDESEHGSWA